MWKRIVMILVLFSFVALLLLYALGYGRQGRQA